MACNVISFYSEALLWLSKGLCRSLTWQAAFDGLSSFCLDANNRRNLLNLVWDCADIFLTYINNIQRECLECLQSSGSSLYLYSWFLCSLFCAFVSLENAIIANSNRLCWPTSAGDYANGATSLSRMTRTKAGANKYRLLAPKRKIRKKKKYWNSSFYWEGHIIRIECEPGC